MDEKVEIKKMPFGAFFIIDFGILNIPVHINQRVLVLQVSQLFGFGNGWLDFYDMVSVFQQIAPNISDLSACLGKQQLDTVCVFPMSTCRKNRHHHDPQYDDSI